MTPTDITLNQKSRELLIAWPTGETHTMSCEYLRVHSPSAEVRGHGPGQERLQMGRKTSILRVLNRLDIMRLS